MVSVDGSIIIQIVNFLVLIFILNMVLYKPIRKILRERKEKISGLEQTIGNLTGDAQEQDKAYGVGIREARAKGQKEKEALMQTAANEEREIISKINQKAQAELAEIKTKITEDTEAVRTALKKDVDSFAGAITQKILGRAVS
jgi:F-type H+-transporting ATPase subunit b